MAGCPAGVADGDRFNVFEVVHLRKSVLDPYGDQIAACKNLPRAEQDLERRTLRRLQTQQQIPLTVLSEIGFVPRDRSSRAPRV